MKNYLACKEVNEVLGLELQCLLKVKEDLS